MTRPLSRRAALVLGGAAVVGAVAGCSTGSTVTAPPPPEVPLQRHTRWTARPDGPLPATGDEGVPFTTLLSNTTAQPTLRGGALVGNLPAAQSAVYVTQPLGAPVRRLGARIAFGPGAASGSVALVAWNGAPTVDRVDGHLHMVFTPDRWIAGVLEGGTVREVARADYGLALPQDGTPRPVEVVVAGDTATLRLPDGTTTAVRDPRFASGSGVVAVWEFYKDAADSAEVTFAETWAG
ncbi:hypothetical protein [Actinomycetospora termitidis]|uniref:Lipoprotein n=1 Tax=Actinomycetospora termitidis TaxID=3053470 RepID=A0ABT7MIJ4_9PSEU|nr:hypothetical protein [Actinomycetospora sp. Odt1-22]MDL5159148.1 hypothetical protein [Actinomycetospora sp. Odt1-22]